MHLKRLYIVGLLLIIFSKLAIGANDDGNDLLKQCSPILKDNADIIESEIFGIGFCLGMMNSATNFIAINESETGKKVVCLPEKGLTNGQAARIVIKYLNDNPQNLHYANSSLIYIALKSAFPCTK